VLFAVINPRIVGFHQAPLTWVPSGHFAKLLPLCPASFPSFHQVLHHPKPPFFFSVRIWARSPNGFENPLFCLPVPIHILCLRGFCVCFFFVLGYSFFFPLLFSPSTKAACCWAPAPPGIFFLTTVSSTGFHRR